VWGEGFFSFFFGSQCVLFHFHLLRPLEPHPPPLPPLHKKNKNHDPPKPLTHASFGKEKNTLKSPHPPSKSQKYLPQHPIIPHPKVDIFNFLDCPPIEASLGLSTLFWGVAESASQRLLTGWNGQVQTDTRTDGNRGGRPLLHRPLPPPPPKTSVTDRRNEFIYLYI